MCATVGARLTVPLVIDLRGHNRQDGADARRGASNHPSKDASEGSWEHDHSSLSDGAGIILHGPFSGLRGDLAKLLHPPLHLGDLSLFTLDRGYSILGKVLEHLLRSHSADKRDRLDRLGIHKVDAFYIGLRAQLVYPAEDVLALVRFVLRLVAGDKHLGQRLRRIPSASNQNVQPAVLLFSLFGGACRHAAAGQPPAHSERLCPGFVVDSNLRGGAVLRGVAGLPNLLELRRGHQRRKFVLTALGNDALHLGACAREEALRVLAKALPERKAVFADRRLGERLLFFGQGRQSGLLGLPQRALAPAAAGSASVHELGAAVALDPFRGLTARGIGGKRRDTVLHRVALGRRDRDRVVDFWFGFGLGRLRLWQVNTFRQFAERAEERVPVLRIALQILYVNVTGNRLLKVVGQRTEAILEVLPEVRLTPQICDVLLSPACHVVPQLASGDQSGTNPPDPSRER